MNSKRLSEATAFAASAHEGVYRKGTKIPYIAHVIEAGLVAMTLTADEDVIIAAFLHDIVEDTDYELSDIKERFGNRVAELVAYESEDKMRERPASDTWKLRKEAFLEHLKCAPLEAKIICLADKLSNMRQSAKAYAEKGDDIWLVFNQKDKKEQEWYYRSIYALIPELKDMDAYKEYVGICDTVFGSQHRSGQKTCECRQEHRLVMYEPLISDQNKVPGLEEFAEAELNKIRMFFDDQGVEGILPQPYVFLSDRPMTRSYGKFSEEDLAIELSKYEEKMTKVPMYGYFLEIIETLIQNLQAMSGAQRNENEADRVWMEMNRTMAKVERMIALEGTDEDKMVLSDIIDLLSQLKVSDDLILGEYLPERHQIIIYYKTIRESCYKCNLDFDAKLSSVLAHEYFHAMHCAMEPDNPLWISARSKIKEYQKKVIKEALADFFSVFWCYNQAQIAGGRFMEVAAERFDSWKKYLYSSWPYAKALYLTRSETDKQFPEKLSDEVIVRGVHALFPVLDESIKNMAEAYVLLRGR